MMGVLFFNLCIYVYKYTTRAYVFYYFSVSWSQSTNFHHPSVLVLAQKGWQRQNAGEMRPVKINFSFCSPSDWSLALDPSNLETFKSV